MHPVHLSASFLVLTLLFYAQGCLSSSIVDINELALGDQSLLQEEFQDIPIAAMADFNGKSKEEILTLREEQVKPLAKSLLLKQYSASPQVFGQIVSGKPWWGIAGCTIYGSGEKSDLGPSEESRFILNPYLLVGISSWSNEIWDKEALDQSIWSKPDFPFCWTASRLRIYPESRTLETTYEVSLYNNALREYDSYRSDEDPVDRFDLVAYNARDLGFNYLFVPEDRCLNIELPTPEEKPIQIVQYIHCGGSSGYPGGSNNMSPLQKEIHGYTLKELPAKLEVKLWRQKPKSIEKKSDLTVFIDFR